MLKVILALLIITGLGVSIWDWRSWRQEETRNFGKGPTGVAPLELTQVYQNKPAGFRARYPGGWGITENAKLKMQNAKTQIKIQNREWIVEMGSVKVSVEKKAKNMPDVVDDEVRKLGKLSREREYIGLGQGTAVILTWTDEKNFFQRAMVEHGERIVLLDLEADVNTEVQVLEKTFTEMVRGLTLI